MRFLDWVQTRINGRPEKKFDASNGSAHYSPRKNSCEEEFKDWPQTLLAIGTFGNKEAVMEEKRVAETSDSLQENEDLCIEEVIKLQNEISKLLNQTSTASTDAVEIETEHTPSSKISEGDEIIVNKSKDLAADKNNAMRRRSLSFLLKKMLVFRNGYALHPNIRDHMPETRMEKILRKIIHKKIHPQAGLRATSVKYLQRNYEEEKGEDGGKWVKTDSEYIVLEI